MHNPNFKIWPFLALALFPFISGADLCVSETLFGSTNTGEAVQRFLMNDSNGLTVSLMSVGATITEIQAPDREGQKTNVILGKDDWDTYRNGFGGSASVIGRFANRIQGAEFEIDGERFELDRNNGRNHIHGGRGGFAGRNWKGKISAANQDEVAVTFTLTSPDGDQGYPGELIVQVTYTLTRDQKLKIAYQAKTSRPTHINLTNHAYFNLAGDGDVLEQQLRINSGFYTPTDRQLIPTGETLSVLGSPLDFTELTAIGSRMKSLPENYNGYDHNFVLGGRQTTPVWIAEAVDPKSGRRMDVWTTEPGVQLYTGNHLRHRGFCLETQSFPNAPNTPHFPSTLLSPGEVFHSETVYGFSVAE